MQQKLNELVNWLRRQPRWRLYVAGAVLVLVGWLLWHGGNGEAVAKIPTFAARRGALEINVLEGGSLQALESQEVKCEVRVGYQGTKILKIVEEGYFVTESDVTNGKVLVELDSSELEKQIAQQEIQYQQAVASLIDAQQNYEIQLNQNKSDIKAAQQKVRFARMDFDKLLGDTVTAKIVQDLGLDRLLAEAGSNDVEQASHATEPNAGDVVTKPTTNLVAASGPGNSEATARELSAGPALDFTQYASIEKLGDGEAKQKLRKFEDDLQVAQKELGQARATLEGTKRLFDKAFVARTELVRDQLSQDSAELKVKSAETARALYLKYEFPKTAEESLSKYTEAVRELDKARRVAISRLAQARAKLKSAQGQNEVQTRQRKDLAEQLDKCTIHAKKSGLVVYGGGRDDGVYYGNQEPIREGATVRERQAIITIPDMTRMSVSVKIHESYIKKIKKGQTARITVDAFPDTVLTGEVTKMGVLPDSQNRFLNPDLKVYNTTIAINGTCDWTKPGMSAKVEILVNKLADAIYVPVQAILPDDGKQICYVAGSFKPERREVEVGDFNDEFIEIKKGLKEGERVLLRPPDGLESTSLESRHKSDSQKPTNPEPAAKSAGGNKS